MNSVRFVSMHNLMTVLPRFFARQLNVSPSVSQSLGKGILAEASLRKMKSFLLRTGMPSASSVDIFASK